MKKLVIHPAKDNDNSSNTLKINNFIDFLISLSRPKDNEMQQAPSW